MTIRVDPVTTMEAETLAGILEWRRTGIVPEAGSIPPEKINAAASALARDEFWVLGARSADILVGYLTACFIPKADPRKGTIYVDELWVSPGWRRQGIARALLDATLDLAKKEGAWRIRLAVAGGNMAARELYLSAGFKTTPCFYCEREVTEEPGN